MREENNPKKNYFLSAVGYSNVIAIITNVYPNIDSFSFPFFFLISHASKVKCVKDNGSTICKRCKRNGLKCEHHVGKIKKKKKKNESPPKAQEAQGSESEGDEEEKETTTPTTPRQIQQRVISSSSYYEDYYNYNEDNEDPMISLSFETAARKVEPFDEISACLLRLERKRQQQQRLSLRNRIHDSKTLKKEFSEELKKILTRVAPLINGGSIDNGDDHYYHRDRYLKAFEELNGIHTIIRLFLSHNNHNGNGNEIDNVHFQDGTTDSISNDSNVTERIRKRIILDHSISKLAIQILRDACVVCSITQSLSSSSLSPPPKPTTITPVTMMTSISLTPFRDYSSYAEKIATVLVQQEKGLEFMLLIASDEYYYRRSISNIDIIVDVNNDSNKNNDPGNSNNNSSSNNNSNNKITHAFPVSPAATHHRPQTSSLSSPLSSPSTLATRRFSPRRRSTIKPVNYSESSTRNNNNNSSNNDYNSCITTVTNAYDDDDITILINNNKPEDIFETVRDIWSLYVNVTYYGSITKLMGREQILLLADVAYWAITTLDCNVNNKLIQCGIIPSPLGEEIEEEEEGVVGKNGKKRRSKSDLKSKSKSKATKRTSSSSSSSPTSNRKKNASKNYRLKQQKQTTKQQMSSENNDYGFRITTGMGDDEAVVGRDKEKNDDNNNPNDVDDTTTTIVVDNDSTKVMIAKSKIDRMTSRASRILEPILGTIRNLIADPITTKCDWEVKSSISKLLDILCKEREQQYYNNDNDDANNTVVFRWTEQEENIVWIVLGVLKVCSDKGILSTWSNDVQSLIELYIRYIRKFGSYSIRIVRRVLGLVDGLLFITGENIEGVKGEEKVDIVVAVIPKEIMKRSSYLKELNQLSNKFYCDVDHNNNNNSNSNSNNNSEQMEIYNEIQTSIAKLSTL